MIKLNKGTLKVRDGDELKDISLLMGGNGGNGGMSEEQVQLLEKLQNEKIGHVERTTNGNSTTTSYYDSPKKEHLILSINETNPIGSDFTSAQKTALKKVANVATMPTDNVESAGKVWGTTSDGAGWVDAPEGGSGGVTEEYLEQIIGLAMQTANQQIAENYYDKNETDERYALKGEGGEGLSTEAKTALLACMEYVAWSGTDGLAKYNALATALGMPTKDAPTEPDIPPAEEITLTGITASYNGGAVDAGTATSALNVTVRGLYSDGSSRVLTGYTLSPSTVAEGSNTITVRYGGKSATFSVTGNAVTQPDVPRTIERIRSVYTGGSVDSGTSVYGMDGLTVYVDFTDGTSEVATDYTASPATITADTEVKITCRGFKASFNVGLKKTEVTNLLTAEVLGTVGSVQGDDGQKFASGYFTDFIELEKNADYYTNIGRYLNDGTQSWNQKLYLYDASKNRIKTATFQHNNGESLNVFNKAYTNDDASVAFARLVIDSRQNSPYFGISPVGDN